MTHDAKTPRFTIVVPVLNADATLAQTIQSVFDQSHQAWELILVDDGSSDDSVLICETAAALDGRVTVLESPGSGPATARNFGAAYGTGDFIAFLDADDVWAPDRLEQMTAGFAARPSAGCLFSRVRLIEADGGQEIGATPHIYRLLPEDLLGEFPITTSSNLVFRRRAFEQVDGFDPDMDAAEDQDIVLRLVCLTGWTVKGVNAVLLDYRLNVESLSARLAPMEAGWKHMIEKAEGFAPLLVKSSRRRAAAIFHRQQALRAVRGVRRPLRAVVCLMRAFMNDPALLLRSPLRTAKACVLVFTTLILKPIERSHP